MRAEQILETCLYVNDLSAAEAFYSRVLGLAVRSRREGRHVFFRCGERMFLLFNPLQTEQPSGNVPTHGAQGRGHVAFVMHESEIQVWRDQLRQHAVTIETEIDWPGGGHSIYFRDPAGNSVELATPRTWDL
jgi:catechol 2,3-dioxygenase-like lactoylglutathione lyase family enzyme